jgi:hypothetical protein
MAALTIELDSKGIYEIKIDNDGDGVEDTIFQIRFPPEERGRALQETSIKSKQLRLPAERVIPPKCTTSNLESPPIELRLGQTKDRQCCWAKACRQGSDSCRLGQRFG